MKEIMLSTARMGSGIEFQIAGRAIENALSQKLVLVLDTVKLLLTEERAQLCLFNICGFIAERKKEKKLLDVKVT